jgi:hypothetical protein
MGTTLAPGFGAASARASFVYGERAADLTRRLGEAASARGIRLLALKGVAVADELYGGFDARPVADADVWVLDAGRFAEAASIAASLGLGPFDRSDHVLALREEGTGVILELHARPCSAADCFDFEPDRVWNERVEVRGRGFARPGALDALVHASLHGVFQHGLAVKPYHLEDFRRGLTRWSVDSAALLERARSMRAERCVGAFAHAAGVDGTLGTACPPGVRRALRHGGLRPGALDEGVPTLARLFMVRLRSVDPSRRWTFVHRAIAPRALPGFPREPVAARGLRLLRRLVGR